ncbi:MAG: arginine decarboxylase [Patescibacteria group bacterium]|nr:arginine decarboxylase [Patescibacteria group bacterium]
METRTVRPLTFKVLITSGEVEKTNSVGRAVDNIAKELMERNIEVIKATSSDDATAIIVSDSSLDAVMIEWEMENSLDVITALRYRNKKVPIFLMQDHSSASVLPINIMEMISEIVFMLEDTAPFIAGRVQEAAKRYITSIAPPMTRDLIKFATVHEYSWHTPGHTGGIAFLKTAVGRGFYEYFGENLFRSDLSISVGELGSLLDHSGSIGESEKYIARIFGADRSYTVTNGSSTSNRMIYMASITLGDIALCDRNCHKSVEQAMAISGATPTYLVPLRNYLGIIGPIPPEKLTKESTTELIAKNPLSHNASHHRATHATVTNSTYDGICYSAKRVVELLGQSVDRIHFDEAWYGYARFNKMYVDRFGMYGKVEDYPDDAPTVITTQSTHKLLAALSQASYIHVRDGRNSIDHNRFNEAFMMNSSTSPFYPMIASNEVAASMMDEAGELLTTESIREAVDFRQMVMKYNRELSAETKNGWFFTTWNPDEVTDPKTGGRVSFAKADPELLTTNPDCWILHPNESWHGYGDLEDGYAMLDPIKVSVVTPGVNRDGTMAETGIPAMLLVSYLDAKGIVNEKTTDFTVLFLFSMGITKGKWGTLLNAMLEFKRDYDVNTSLRTTIPSLVANYPERYEKMGLRDLADEMFVQMKSTHQTKIQSEAYEILPRPDTSPYHAYQQLVHNNIEQLPISEIAHRTLGTGIVPYPPGIPLLMPGENAGPADGPLIGYLTALEKFDRKFPGFGHDTHGVENINGTYYVYCLKKNA